MQLVFLYLKVFKILVWRGFSSRARFCPCQYSLARFGLSAEQEATDPQTKPPRLLPVAQPEPLCFSPRAPLSFGLTRQGMQIKTRGKPRSIGLRAYAFGFSFFLTEKLRPRATIHQEPTRPSASLPFKIKKFSLLLYIINNISVV